MYMWSLYIAVSATVLSYLYLTVLPFYAQQVWQGAQADEVLWWHAIFHAPPQSKMTFSVFLTTLSHALIFGLILGLCVVYIPWLPVAGTELNILIMTIWLGGLSLLARLDRLCYLLPDVLTQFLLWVGLVVIWQQGTMPLMDAMSAAISVYIIGRLLNSLVYFWLKQPLFGQGDVKLMAAIAAWLGWQPLLAILFWACVLCIMLEAVRQRRLMARGHCAFGPYIVLATLGVWFSTSLSIRVVFNV